MTPDTVLATITIPQTLAALYAQLNTLTPPLAVIVNDCGQALGVVDATTIAHAQVLGHIHYTPALHAWPLPGRGTPVLYIYGTWEVVRRAQHYVVRPAQPQPETTVAWQRIAQLLEPPVIPLIQRLCAITQAHGSTLYLVGGAARSVYDGQAIHDLDLALSGNVPAVASTIATQLGGTLISHGPFGTASVDLPPDQTDLGIQRLDFVPTRSEHYAKAGALPQVVASDITTDTRRRDISVNAIAIELRIDAPCPVYDPFAGQRDLARRQLRLLHPLSFCDDPTRIIRVARIMERLKLRPRHTLSHSIQATLAHHSLQVVSHQRWYHEIVKTLHEHDPVPALSRLWRWRVWQALHPAFAVHPRHFPHLARVPNAYRLVAWLWQAPTDTLQALGETWNALPRHIRTLPALKVAVGALSAQTDLRPSHIMEHLGDYDRAMLHAIGIGDPVVAQLANHIDHIMAHTPPLLLNGHDIIAVGVPHGPQIKQALQMLQVALYDGDCQAQSRAEQLAWVYQHLERT